MVALLRHQCNVPTSKHRIIITAAAFARLAWPETVFRETSDLTQELAGCYDSVAETAISSRNGELLALGCAAETVTATLIQSAFGVP